MPAALVRRSSGRPPLLSPLPGPSLAPGTSCTSWTKLRPVNGRSCTAVEVTGELACFHGEVLCDGCLEAAGFDGDGVMSGRKKREAIVAGTVGLAGARLVGPEVGQGDGGTGNDRARGIGDRAENISSG